MGTDAGTDRRAHRGHHGGGDDGITDDAETSWDVDSDGDGRPDVAVPNRQNYGGAVLVLLIWRAIDRRRTPAA